jgi:hypothetical protein
MENLPMPCYNEKIWSHFSLPLLLLSSSLAPNLLAHQLTKQTGEIMHHVELPYLPPGTQTITALGRLISLQQN